MIDLNPIKFSNEDDFVSNLRSKGTTLKNGRFVDKATSVTIGNNRLKEILFQTEFMDWQPCKEKTIDDVLEIECISGLVCYTVKVYKPMGYKLTIADDNAFLMIKGLNSEFCIEAERVCGDFKELIFAVYNSLKVHFDVCKTPLPAFEKFLYQNRDLKPA